jgi:hypothetical protein
MDLTNESTNAPPSVTVVMFAIVGRPSASWNAPATTMYVGHSRNTVTKARNGSTPR